MQASALSPGEDVKIVDNRVTVSGQIAVMKINALIVKTIVEKNPDREFYLEESFPLEWTYPHLEPHGLIFKLHQEPLAVLTETAIAKDRDYWKRYVKELIGDWVTDETSVKEICDFGEKVFLKKDLGGFTGDIGFARNEETPRVFSKLRSAIAGNYAWRAEHGNSAAEKERMLKEADFAFRQALALCAYSKETAQGYASLLLSRQRQADARLVARVFLRHDPADNVAKELVKKVDAAR